MKFFVANILLICCLFFTNSSYSQLPQCCRTKKVKIKKGKKNRKGGLVGVKGYDDKKALKSKMKKMKSDAKIKKNEMKLAAKEEEKSETNVTETLDVKSKEENIIEDSLKGLDDIQITE